MSELPPALEVPAKLSEFDVMSALRTQFFHSALQKCSSRQDAVFLASSPIPLAFNDGASEVFMVKEAVH